MADVIKIPGTLSEKSICIGTGTEFCQLNPVQDINGNWCISLEEWNSKDFSRLKEKYSANTLKQFTQILWQPKTL